MMKLIKIGRVNLTARSSSTTNTSSQGSISTQITIDFVTSKPHELSVSSPYFPININDIIYNQVLKSLKGHSGKSADGIIVVFCLPELPNIVC